MPRSLANRLRAAQRNGAILATQYSDAVTVVWSPLPNSHDRPWLGSDGNRYYSYDLKPMRPEGVEVSPERDARLRSGPLGRMAEGEFPYLAGDTY